jgi:outer membrane receptor protein involved in Fe transport
VDPKYRAAFVGQSQYQPGATFTYLPEHTWALGVTYAQGASSLALNLTGTGSVRILNNDFYFQSLNSSIRLQQNQLNVSNVGGYIAFNRSYTLADLTASRRFTPHVEALLQVQNLADHYTNDTFGGNATLGRQTKVGARIRM